MAVKQHINTPVNINPGLSIKFVSPLELADFQAKGYSFMMSRKPNIALLLKLTEQEIAITKLLLLGNSSQQIAGLLSMDDRNVRNALQSIREKLGCDNNIELVVKIKDDGLDSYFFQNG